MVCDFIDGPAASAATAATPRVQKHQGTGSGAGGAGGVHHEGETALAGHLDGLRPDQPQDSDSFKSTIPSAIAPAPSISNFGTGAILTRATCVSTGTRGGNVCSG